jgi:hypothetical protein
MKRLTKTGCILLFFLCGYMVILVTQLNKIDSFSGFADPIQLTTIACFGVLVFKLLIIKKAGNNFGKAVIHKAVSVFAVARRSMKNEKEHKSSY